MKRTRLGLRVAGGAVLLAAAQPAAHHSFAAVFDANQPVTVHGIITEVRLENPHSWFFVDVRGVGLAEVNDPPNTRKVGQPQLFHVAPEPFWIEAGEKRVMRWTGSAPDADRFFELVNRVDVDLRFE